MAAVFFAELSLPQPDHSLGIGGGSHAEQTGRMLVALESVLEAARPDAAIVFGDTTTTLAGTLAAVRQGIPVAHVESGMRSFDRRMPEEVNRVISDHLATWRLAATPTAVENLAREGITDRRLRCRRPHAGPCKSRERRGSQSRCAGHGWRGSRARGRPRPRRASQTRGVSSSQPFIVPRTVSRPHWPCGHRSWPMRQARVAPSSWRCIPARGWRSSAPTLSCQPPSRSWSRLGYRTSLTLQLHAAAVLTDSGGVQREAAWLGTPCLVLRSTTEWTEAVRDSAGRMVVVGLDRRAVANELERLAPPARAPRRWRACGLAGLTCRRPGPQSALLRVSSQREPTNRDRDFYRYAGISTGVGRVPRRGASRWALSSRRSQLRVRHQCWPSRGRFEPARVVEDRRPQARLVCAVGHREHPRHILANACPATALCGHAEPSGSIVGSTSSAS